MYLGEAKKRHTVHIKIQGRYPKPTSFSIAVYEATATEVHKIILKALEEASDKEDSAHRA